MEGLQEFTAVALFGLAVYTIQNLIRYVRAANWNGVLAILLAFAGGWLAVTLGAHASVTETLVLIKGAPQLGRLDGGSLILLGIGVGSLAPVVADLRGAVDNSDTAQKPKLVP